jgi:hypothetical protein
VDVAVARDALGVGAETPWPEVRAAYLRLVREHHPDGASDAADAGVRTLRTAALTEAYATLRPHQPVPDPVRDAPQPPRRATPTLEDVYDDSRRVLLDASMVEAYAALVEVFHLVGVISYLDRESAVLEAIVTPVPGQATSLLAFLEPSLEGPEVTEAVFGVEPLGSHPPAPLDPLVDEIARLLAMPRPTSPDADLLH